MTRPSRGLLACVLLLVAGAAGCVTPPEPPLDVVPDAGSDDDHGTDPDPAEDSGASESPRDETRDEGAGTPRGHDGRLELSPADRCRAREAVPTNASDGGFNASFETSGDAFRPDCAWASGSEDDAVPGWTVTRTTRVAADGNASLALTVDPDSPRNGTVWVERVLRMPDDAWRHDGNLTFRARTEDAGVEVVAWAGLRSPYAVEHFTPNEDGSATIPGTLQLRTPLNATGEWTTFTLTGPLTTGSDDALHVAVGFTREGAGTATMHVDDVRFSAAP